MEDTNPALEATDGVSEGTAVASFPLLDPAAESIDVPTGGGYDGAALEPVLMPTLLK